LTGYTREEFDALLPDFKQQFLERMRGMVHSGKKLLYKLAESGGAFGDSKWQKLLNLARQTPFSTAFELVFKVLAVRKCKGVFASYEVEMNHAGCANTA
jgi:hypothetical protein